MVKDRIIYWISILQSLLRSSKNAGYYVLSYPKSGSNWLCNMLSDYFDIPVLEVWKEKMPVFSRRIYHMHRIIPFRHKDSKCVYIVRDGRDVVVSYFFMMTRSPAGVKLKQRFERYIGRRFDENEIVDIMPVFIEFLENNRLASVTYRMHILGAHKHNYIRVRFEDLKQNCERTMTRVVEALSEKPADLDKLKFCIEKNMFENIRTDQNSHFLRKGEAGDWVNYFNKNAAIMFWKYNSDVMTELGYEVDDSWIDSVVIK